MKPVVARTLRFAVTAVILVFLVIFARTVDWSAAWQSIRQASLTVLLAAVFVNLVSMALKGLRWWLFLRPAGSPSLGLAMRASLAGAGLNNVLVANGGDAARVVFVSRATGLPASRVLATLALERMFDPIGFVILLVVAPLFVELPPTLERWRLPAEITLAVIAVAMIYFVYKSKDIRPEHVPERRAEPRGVWGRVRASLAAFAMNTRSLTTGPRFAGALVISLLSWIGQLLTFMLAASAAHVEIPVAGSLAAMLAVNLGFVLRLTPGNVGFFQFMYALIAERFGVPRESAIAVSLLIQTLQILPLTVLGVALAPEFIFRKSVRAEDKVPGSLIP